ncbi:hypothetical protein BJV77DRAFT_740022 [Russula vinacea]|nr:hypothetical protein BJV77DRAFT_740022 [Russula vinacea]
MPSPTTLKSTKPMLSSTHRSSPRKARIARGRRRANGFHSDDEIEREARSDSDSDEDDQTSVDSDTDSETGPPSEDTPHDGHPTLLSPSTTPPAIDGSKDGDDHAPLLAAAVTWSDVVADEMANGTSELPVIDFADLDANVINATTPPAPVHRRAPKSKRPAPHRHSSEPAVAIASSGPSPEPPIAPASPKEPPLTLNQSLQHPQHLIAVGEQRGKHIKTDWRMTLRMFPLWANFGAMMIDCWIKTCAGSPHGGANAGRVGHEGAVLVFGDADRGVIAETPMQATMATRMVKYHPRHWRMCRR